MSFADVVPTTDTPPFVSASPPVGAQVGWVWFDTTTNAAKYWDGVAWKTISGSTPPAAFPTPPGPDMFLKSGLTNPYNPVWSEYAEGGTF